MKIILVLILIFISSTFNSTTLKSSYSLLLDDIREDVIDTALLNLPKRGSVDILKMYLLMAEEKEKNSLNDAESAFLVYKWIAQNIKINCYYMYKKEQSDLEIYKSGEGYPSSISSLFNSMCAYMNIESDSISGYYKTHNLSEYYLQYTEFTHTYNYIIISNKTYLVDPTLGIGYCDDCYYHKFYSDFYFGTKPDFLINSHFPKYDNFQLLDDLITKAQWSSLVFIRPLFYLIGMKSITPESGRINLNQVKKIVINYDALNNDLHIIEVQIIYPTGGKTFLQDITRKNGILEISLENWYRIDGYTPVRIEIYNRQQNDPSRDTSNLLVYYQTYLL